MTPYDYVRLGRYLQDRLELLIEGWTGDAKMVNLKPLDATCAEDQERMLQLAEQMDMDLTEYEQNEETERHELEQLERQYIHEHGHSPNAPLYCPECKIAAETKCVCTSGQSECVKCMFQRHGLARCSWCSIDVCRHYVKRDAKHQADAKHPMMTCDNCLEYGYGRNGCAFCPETVHESKWVCRFCQSRVCAQCIDQFRTEDKCCRRCEYVLNREQSAASEARASDEHRQLHSHCPMCILIGYTRGCGGYLNRWGDRIPSIKRT